MLVLFDIDGTLLRTRGVGIGAMVAACREIYEHPAFTSDGVDVSGRLDHLIWHDLMARNGLDPTPARFDRFLERFPQRFAEMIAAPERPVFGLSGAVELVRAVHEHATMTAGLLTGNLSVTGRMKIEAIGLDPDWFVVCAWGSDGRIRRDLPPVAMARYATSHGRALRPEHVVIIGDTPHDVDCAAAHGCRCLAVATGAFSVEQLAACGADRVVPDLSNTADLLGWIDGLRA